jgi:hypothetical protein
MAGCERGRFVEEEQFREAAGLHQRPASPPAEFEPAGDPALAVEATADATGLVVEAAAIPVDEASRWIRDELAERRDAILQRHSGLQRDATPGSRKVPELREHVARLFADDRG